MPPTGTSISNIVNWNDILGGVNAIAPVLGLPLVLGLGIAIVMGVLGYTLTQTKKGFSPATAKADKIKAKPAKSMGNAPSLSDMAIIPTTDAPPPPPAKSDDPIEQAILSQLQGGQAHIDDLVRETGLPTHQVSSALTMLELKGDIKGQTGGHYNLAQTTTAAPAESTTTETPKKRTNRRAVASATTTAPASRFQGLIDIINSILERLGLRRRSDPRYQRVEPGQPKVYIPIAERREEALQDEIEARQDEERLTPPKITENIAHLVPTLPLEKITA